MFRIEKSKKCKSLGKNTLLNPNQLRRTFNNLWLDGIFPHEPVGQKTLLIHRVRSVMPQSFQNEVRWNRARFDCQSPVTPPVFGILTHSFRSLKTAINKSFECSSLESQPQTWIQKHNLREMGKGI